MWKLDTHDNTHVKLSEHRLLSQPPEMSNMIQRLIAIVTQYASETCDKRVFVYASRPCASSSPVPICSVMCWDTVPVLSWNCNAQGTLRRNKKNALYQTFLRQSFRQHWRPLQIIWVPISMISVMRSTMLDFWHIGLTLVLFDQLFSFFLEPCNHFNSHRQSNIRRRQHQTTKEKRLSIWCNTTVWAIVRNLD